MKKRIGAFLTAALMCAMALVVPASAARLPEPDLDRTGAINVSVTCKEHGKSKPLEGVELTVYRVAGAEWEDGGLFFRPAEGLEELEEDMNGKLTAAASRRLAGKLASSGKLAELWSDGPQATDKKGKASFEELELGLYLVVQTGGGEGFESIGSFLAALPMANQSGTGWKYEVDASPKVEPGTPDYPNPPEPEEPTEPGEPEEPEEPTEPEEPGPEEPEKPTEPTLPQTGMTRWPVFVLVVGGMLLFSLGWVIERRGQDDES